MAMLWYLAAPGFMTTEERQLWEKVRSAQLHLSQWREENGIASSKENDPWNCGLIGADIQRQGVVTTLAAVVAVSVATAMSIQLLQVLLF